MGDFIRRRGDKRIADNLVSAVYHGIYAGDIWQLSARSLLPLQWEQEARYENLVTAMWESLVKKEGWQFADDLECQMALQEQELSEKLQRKAVGASVITLKKGLGQLSKTLTGRLRSNERVHFSMNEAVTGVRPVEGGLEVRSLATGLSLLLVGFAIRTFKALFDGLTGVLLRSLLRLHSLRKHQQGLATLFLRWRLKISPTCCQSLSGSLFHSPQATQCQL